MCVETAAFLFVGTMAKNELTPMQEAFVSAYLGGKKGEFRPFHGTKAAISAGYSPKSAASQASDLLKNPKVIARVQEELTVRAMPAEAVLAELTDVATAEWRDFIIILDYDDAGKPLHVKMDMNAKMKGLELLGKHHQLFSENLNISGGIEVREFVGIPDDAP
jgi:phage terminase small subunit